MSKIKEVVLIDDSDTDNYIHKRCIEKSGCAHVCEIFTMASEALEWLKDNDQKVNLIFLDINMPQMDGFEFLVEYEKLHHSKQADLVIVMLTSSANDKDIIQANQLGVGYHTKPLTTEAFIEVINAIDAK